MDEQNNGTKPVLLTREQILAAGQRKTKTITAWGGPVQIKQLSAARATEIHESFDGVARMAAWICESMVDEDGKPMFQPTDIETVMGMGAAEVIRVGSEIVTFNGLDALAQQEAEKNSGTQVTGSPSN
jgi:hypothetical protein